jgi:hypothetical protein
MAKLKEVRALKSLGIGDRPAVDAGRAHSPPDLGRLSCRGDLRPLRVAARAPAQRCVFRLVGTAGKTFGTSSQDICAVSSDKET